ncbi:hypothetical protein [Vitiosangium sp. GDMCC 1.1324]|uniref:hypothetical protein n=1 Tax=Vitiosangium sp. (strain GDMCC 1.1324) TaxID=2138576 RepID=UPI000D3C48A1|nr:hypothetical protein [Vitiosangium sp. GDMCC 1.1324]PTL79629.1 hypothetical protein DAT35_33005 [Vitiosangium sp. GDMCC 1.1324]
MLALTLAAVLAAANPSPVEAWSKKACPPPKQTPDSNVEMKFVEQQRAECLRKAMNKSLDKVLVPLKKQKPAAFKDWMALQADYNRWLADACAAVEEANWVDLSTGERSMGTGYGFTESQCRQRQFAWRGFYADAWARKDWNAIQQALQAYAEPARKARESLQSYRSKSQEAAARAPAHVEESDLPVRPIPKDDWKPYLERLDRAASGPEALSRRQCALVPSPSPDCAQRFADSLSAQMDFSDALSNQESGG